MKGQQNTTSIMAEHQIFPLPCKFMFCLKLYSVGYSQKEQFHFFCMEANFTTF